MNKPILNYWFPILYLAAVHISTFPDGISTYLRRNVMERVEWIRRQLPVSIAKISNKNGVKALTLNPKLGFK